VEKAAKLSRRRNTKGKEVVESESESEDEEDKCSEKLSQVGPPLHKLKGKNEKLDPHESEGFSKSRIADDLRSHRTDP
jgi:hypothetical protein